MIRYADDFIVTAKTPETLTEQIKPAITRFLRARGLELSEEKTKTTSIEAGFDFLGQNIRKYSGTLRIQPAKASVQGILDKVRLVIDKHKGQSAERLIKVLNPIIRGWAQYHRHSVCAQGFYRVDRFIGEALFRWIRRKNPKKSKSWIVWKHFRSPLERTGGFCVKSKDRGGQTVYYHLYRARQTVALRYRKVVAALHPFLAGTSEYFARRRSIEHRTYGVSNSRAEFTQGIRSFQT